MAFQCRVQLFGWLQERETFRTCNPPTHLLEDFDPLATGVMIATPLGCDPPSRGSVATPL